MDRLALLDIFAGINSRRVSLSSFDFESFCLQPPSSAPLPGIAVVRKSSVLRAASALGIINEKPQPIMYTPRRAWISQPTTVRKTSNLLIVQTFVAVMFMTRPIGEKKTEIRLKSKLVFKDWRESYKTPSFKTCQARSGFSLFRLY